MLVNQFNVMQGAEEFFTKGSKEIGILLCHGFNGTPQSMKRLGELFSKKGYTVLAPRLRGHGTHIDEFKTVSYHDWISDLIDAYNKMKQECHTVYILGQSMGGTLALNLASKLDDLAGIITLNAAIEVPCYEQYKTMMSPFTLKEGKPDIKDESVFEITYEEVPIQAIHQLLKLIDVTKKELGNVQCPALFIKSSIDHVVPPHSTDFIYKKVGSTIKEVATLYNSYHVASMDFDKEEIATVSSQFINQRLKD